jgi:hypothetical protein
MPLILPRMKKPSTRGKLIVLIRAMEEFEIDPGFGCTRNLPLAKK